ncbi:MAG: ABC transporter permease [Caldilineaceae bacterium SB0661_bin_32]|uniref:ABC transporter permease n=1 Tax=Caldilineaceae bacterium SB0661_bin_32 TaxID=2605255 RepID=A0A6B1D568_9CHLR|nr:ABC transporter permease [Caldilineaceae bacterium SB0661_bin_32]
MSNREASVLSPEGCVRNPSAAAVAGKYWAIFRTQLVNSLAYPIDLLGRSLLIVLFMWIFMNLWQVTYGATGARSIAGLTLADTMWYLMMAEAVMLSKRDLSETITEQVKDGSVAYLLNKPFNFILYHFAAGLGDSVLAFGGNLIIGAAVVWLMVGPPPGLTGWIFAGAAVGLSWLLDFCFSALIGLSAFVVEETNAFRWIYQKFLLLLGGVLIPLDFFPAWLQTVSLNLPFAWIIYGPARLFVDPSLARLGQVFLQQGIWLTVVGGIVWVMYRRAAARLVINGG